MATIKDGAGKPLQVNSFRGRGLMLLRSHGEYLLFNEGERVAAINADQLAYLFDQAWLFLITERHPVLDQPVPTGIYNRPPDAPPPSWWPPEPKEV